MVQKNKNVQPAGGGSKNGKQLGRQLVYSTLQTSVHKKMQEENLVQPGRAAAAMQPCPDGVHMKI
jgi:hypothetical protein